MSDYYNSIAAVGLHGDVYVDDYRLMNMRIHHLLTEKCHGGIYYYSRILGIPLAYTAAAVGLNVVIVTQEGRLFILNHYYPNGFYFNFGIPIVEVYVQDDRIIGILDIRGSLHFLRDTRADRRDPFLDYQLVHDPSSLVFDNVKNVAMSYHIRGANNLIFIVTDDDYLVVVSTQDTTKEVDRINIGRKVSYARGSLIITDQNIAKVISFNDRTRLTDIAVIEEDYIEAASDRHNVYIINDNRELIFYSNLPMRVIDNSGTLTRFITFGPDIRVEDVNGVLKMPSSLTDTGNPVVLFNKKFEEIDRVNTKSARNIG